jgi:hypothetical protein
MTNARSQVLGRLRLVPTIARGGAYREYLSDLQTKVAIAKARLDTHERYGAVRRYFERLAARYERAAIRPWRGVEAEACGAE